MRILHIAYYYGVKNTCGACIAATRLHKALLAHGIDSYYLCFTKREEGTNVHVIPCSPVLRTYFYTINRIVWIFSKLLLKKIYMANFIPLPGFSKAIKSIAPDIIQTHFIHQDMLSLSQLERVKQPLIITLHDILSINPTDAYPGKDVRYKNGLFNDNSSAIERWMFNRKWHLINAKRPVFIGPSKWICDVVNESIIGKGCRTYVVPNIADHSFSYRPEQRIRHSKFTILFGASGGRRSPLKGWIDLESTLRLLPASIRSETCVLIFGEQADNYFVDGVEIKFLGSITSPDAMCRIHNESDIFALPSKEDNAPQTKFEALLCGSPVIAFNRTGCAEYIKNGVNGWIAADNDFESFSKGIEHFYVLKQRGELGTLQMQIAEHTASDLADATIIEKTVCAYRKILESRMSH